MKSNIIITVLLLIIVGGAAFFAGMKYQEAQRPSFARQMMGNGLGNGRMGGALPGMGSRLGLRPLNGEIISADDKSLTVKLADGSVTAQNIQLNPVFRGGVSPTPTL